jgi:hypothetical protein
MAAAAAAPAAAPASAAGEPGLPFLSHRPCSSACVVR